jgi:hypothetical protein
MKKSHTKAWVTAALIAAVTGYVAFTYFQRPQPSFNEAIAFVRSVYPLVEARMQRGSPLPPSVPLSELARDGYITPETVRRFVGSELTFPTQSYSGPVSFERATEGVLISLRQRDGRRTVMTADGSIHQLPK